MNSSLGINGGGGDGEVRRVSFGSGETVLNISTAPHHTRNRASKDAVQRGSKRDVLGLEPGEWDQSVSVPGVCERRSRVNWRHDPTRVQFNYRAEVLPPAEAAFEAKPGRHSFNLFRQQEASKMGPSTRIAEMEVHPGLRDKEQWDLSMVVDRKAFASSSAAAATRCLGNSRRKNKRIVREGYMSPAARETLRMSKLREERTHRRNSPSSSGFHVGGGGPASSDSVDSNGGSGGNNNNKNKNNNRNNNNNKHSNGSPSNGSEDTPKYKKATSSTSRKYREYFNDGVYEYSAVQGCHVWSCSMNPNPEFRGSCYKVRNPDAWNFASP